MIRLTRYAEPAVKAKDEKLMFALIRASFNQRRKTLQNGLNNSQELSFTKEQIAEAIEKMGLSPSVRGEALTLEQFAKLFRPSGRSKKTAEKRGRFMKGAETAGNFILGEITIQISGMKPRSGKIWNIFKSAT